MEYMSIRGSVALMDYYDLDELTQKILNLVEKIEFKNDDGVVTSVLKSDRLWIVGEGLMLETEANKLIKIVKRIYDFSDNTCRVDMQRVRWELNIVLSNEYNRPKPVEHIVLHDVAS